MHLNLDYDHSRYDFPYRNVRMFWKYSNVREVVASLNQQLKLFSQDDCVSNGRAKSTVHCALFTGCCLSNSLNRSVHKNVVTT